MSLQVIKADDECPICLSLIIKPITLPCKHELCMNCLGPILKKCTCCPLCRTEFRRGMKSWRKLERHVNKKRWNQIKKQYPDLVNRKLNGADSDSEEANFALIPKLEHERKQNIKDMTSSDKERDYNKIITAGNNQCRTCVFAMLLVVISIFASIFYLFFKM